MDWMRTMFSLKNYYQLSKWIKNPLPTVKIIQNDVVPELGKVFGAQNPNFQYDFTNQGIKAEALEYYQSIQGDAFYKEDFFNEYIYRYNSIQVTDLKDTNEPFWFFVNINQLQAIEFEREDKIKTILFIEKKHVEIEGRKYEKVYFLYDDISYRSYVHDEENDRYIELVNNPHILGECPAFFIAERQNSQSLVQRKNIISNFQHDLERLIIYSAVFDRLKLFGGVPVASHWNMKSKTCGKKWAGGYCKDGLVYDDDLGAYSVMNGSVQKCSCQEGSVIEAGSVASLKVSEEQLKNPGAKFVDLNANFLKWHFIPSDILTWWDNYINTFPFKEIISSLTGVPDRDNGTPKNIDQIRSMRDRLRNTLVSLSNDFSSRRTKGDWMLFVLRYGKDKVVNIKSDYGTDFYLETEDEVRDMLNKSTNQLDRKNFAERLNMMTYANNKRELLRQNVLRQLMPYVDTPDVDFYQLSNVSGEAVELRANFDKYIEEFEGSVGRIDTVILDMKEISMSKRVDVIRKRLGLMIVAAQPEEEGTDQKATLDAQATLRGSVGGVTGIIGLLESIALGNASEESATAILVQIYGLTEDNAKKIVQSGNKLIPKLKTE